MRIVNILLLSAALVVVSGCDFFRVLAGRPTSAEIEELRAEIERVEAEELKARLDSIEKAKVRMMRDSIARQDSLAIVDAIVSKSGPFLAPTRFRGLVEGDFKARFYVAVGVFRSRANAEGFMAKVERHGYEADLFAFNNGKFTIGVCPSDRIKDLQESLRVISTDPFFPKGAWVLMNE